MNTRPYLLAAAIALCGAASGSIQAAPVAAHAMAAMAASDQAPAAPKLHAALRALWHGHVVHTRDYALAVHAHDAGRAKAAADAVVANAKQLADAVAGFYGKPAGERMLQLLAGHWGGVKALTDARAADDAGAQRRAMDDLDANVAAIAKFLSGANPNLPENAVQGLLAAHVAHHATQIQQIMAGDTKGEQATWAAMQRHMNVIADALADAIARQFPAKAG
ncbi:hypothetical protein ASG87_17345 [Frateuria sp. Soil773]|uniref:hypothetical protein n=1 Tax=Frateuria sp. Soil773 TaxID=1736407 RepID=UPI0006FCD340|nr:hypothetical protein [Frateuria sp. Soil773]KRE94881.1 hypothetical protein ASG87_17345 [Frateuria sp. Soil773]